MTKQKEYLLSVNQSLEERRNSFKPPFKLDIEKDPVEAYYRLDRLLINELLKEIQ